MKQTPQQIKSEEKQMMWAFVLIIIVLFSFHILWPKQPTETDENPMPQEEITQVTNNTEPTSVQEQQIKTTPLITLEKDIKVENGFVSGFISKNGGIFNDLSLAKYKETNKPDSKNVLLLSNNYYAYLKWNYNSESPDFTQGWKTSGNTLSQTTPVTLTWENSQIQIVRHISLDEHYMFTIQDTVKNKTNTDVKANLQGNVRISQEDIVFERSSVHTGFTALIDNKLQENKYDSVKEKTVTYDTTGGWFGITQKYWQTIFIPEQDKQVKLTEQFQDNWYISTFDLAPTTIPAHGQTTQTVRLFAGAKDLDLINAYEKDLNIPKFDLTIDFGWFYFLTKPFLYFLQWLYALVGNMGIAILIFATLLRIVMLPIVTKSYVSMAKLQKIQPQIKVLQERYKDDRPRLQQEVIALYSREHVSPAGGCLPMFIQIIPFYALYKVLSVSLQMRGAKFFGWLNDLSMPDSSSVFTLNGLIPWPVPSIINIGFLPLIMGITMYIQQKMQPAPAGADKTQSGVLKWTPVIFTFMMGNFASGLVLYWTWSNLLSIAQQRYIRKKVG